MKEERKEGKNKMQEKGKRVKMSKNRKSKEKARDKN